MKTGRFSIVVLAVYLIGLAFVAFWPQPVDLNARHLTYAVIRTVRRLMGGGSFNYSQLEFGSNILLFVPFGLLVGLIVGLRLWWIGFFAGVLASTAIEVTQGLLLPDRFASVSDVLANGTGALLGSLLALAIHLLVRAWRAPA